MNQWNVPQFGSLLPALKHAIMKSAAGATKFAGSTSQALACKQLFWSRQAEFIPQIHLAGREGRDGVAARCADRQRILRGLKLNWTAGFVSPPIPKHIRELLDCVLAARFAWRQDQGINSDLRDLRKEVLESAPSFVFRELLCNAFDAHALANRGGFISLRVYASADDVIVIDVSDDGIGIKSVRAGPGLLEVRNNNVDPHWSPVIEGEVGVGLLWAKFVTELHGGTLDFLRNVYQEQRTTVRVTFPPGVLQITYG